ncbi:MAG: glycine--tRNA ligase subunit beta [Deltaproteobacteria bacterium]|nr:glycine--tRNA ligase subunit beta [Deltaproteobacteria bacterium]
MSKELFLEIGCEEIPAGFLDPALSHLESALKKALSEARLSFGELSTSGTPRRLVLSVKDVALRQEDITIENQGPSKKVAYNESGEPTKALIGFAKGQGISIEDIEVRETPKGEYVYAVKEEKGVDAATLLPDVLTDLIASIPFKKSMRWKDLDVAFARPLHWIVALFDGQVVPCSFGDIESSNKSRGHRFLSPEEFVVTSCGDYLDKCEKAFVIVDPEKRKSIIRKGILNAATDAGGRLIEDEGLVHEVTNLVEYPVVLCGNFELEYLKLPREIVIDAMRGHQRYFSVEDTEGNLRPNFITVSNTKARDMNVVREGNERVLRARLSDAAFYYYEDLKTPLDDMVEKLGSVVFQAKLGTSYEKVERFQSLASFLADELVPKVKNKVERAAWLSKGDLVSGVVCEFPSLQGIMGRDYALKAGEDNEVAEAIFEHYLPRSADDILPATDTGAIISIADKLDTICGCFGVGLIPTGASDPYALRRQTIGIINIIRKREYRLSLAKLISRALEILQDKLLKASDEIKGEILEFFRLRLAGLLTGGGYSHDVVDAVLSRGFDDILDTVEIVKALAHLKELPDFEPLAVAFKRVVNITKDFESIGVDPTLFEGDAEEKLHSACHSIAGDVMDLADKGKYKEALLKASQIRPVVDSFFDAILVMVDDVNVKNNRLSLLKEVSGLFMRFADFSKIVTENK